MLLLLTNFSSSPATSDALASAAIGQQLTPVATASSGGSRI